MKWKLYYGDGRTFSDRDGPWQSAPALNVQALVVEDKETGWVLEEGSGNVIQNYAWWPGADRPWGLDYYGTLDYLVHIKVLPAGESVSTLSLQDLMDSGLKLGRSIDTPRFREILKAARDDTYFPFKSARLRRERAD